MKNGIGFNKSIGLKWCSQVKNGIGFNKSIGLKWLNYVSRIVVSKLLTLYFPSDGPKPFLSVESGE